VVDDRVDAEEAGRSPDIEERVTVLNETKLPQVAYPPELKILTQEARKRILAAQKAQDYYDGNFWRYIEAEERKWNGDTYNIPERNTGHDYHNSRKNVPDVDYIPTKLELWYPKFFIDEIASWMFENPVGLESDDEKSYAEIERAHKGSKMDQKLLQGAGEGSKTGGIAVKVLYNPLLSMPRILVRPSRECFPIMDPDDVDVMDKVHFCAIQDDEKTVWRQTFQLVLIDGTKACWVTEALFDLDKIGEEREPTPKAIVRNEALYNGSNYLDFIPVTLIPNEPELGEVWGKSDLEPLYGPINEICRKMSDSGDALKFELFAIKVIMNAIGSNIDDFAVAPGALWMINGDPENPPDVKNLENNMSSMEYLNTYVDRLLDACHQFSGVPRATRDKMDAKGPISGVALKLMFTSIVSKCNRKMMYWKPALEQVYDHVLRTNAVYENFPYDPDKFDLKLTANPRVPQNELEQLEIQATKINMLVKKTVDVMKEMGIKNPEEYLAEVLTERAQIDKAMNPDYTYSRIEGEANAGDEGE
jgi:hypothetical protein